MERASVRHYAHPLERIPGSVPASRLEFIEPCLATTRNTTPAGGEWIHELAYDGSRTQAHLIGGKPTLYTRDGLDCSGTFGSITRDLRLLDARDAILDGEVVVHGTARLFYFVFDLLYLNGFDLRSAPLIRRKRLLAHLLSAMPMRRVRLAEHLEAEGPEVFQRACEMGIAGIVSKKRESAYRGGTQDTWVEVRCAKRTRRASGQHE